MENVFKYLENHDRVILDKYWNPLILSLLVKNLDKKGWIIEVSLSYHFVSLFSFQNIIKSEE